MKLILKIPYYLLVAGIMSIGLLLLATLVPVPGNIKVKIVKSGSMEPAIMTGGLVVVRPVSEYKVGDVITFGADTKTQIPTTHRIIDEAGSGSGRFFTTKGDANDAPDQVQVKTSDISGKVIFDMPYLGYVLDFAKKPLGFTLLVGVPALIVILDEIGKIWTEIRRMRSKKTKNSKDYKERNYDEQKRENTLNSRILDLRPKRTGEVIQGGNNTRSRAEFIAGSMLLVVSLAGFSSHSTISYYNEKEFSLSNTMQARDNYGEIIVNRSSLSTSNVEENIPETVVEEPVPEEIITEEPVEEVATEIIEEKTTETVEEEQVPEVIEQPVEEAPSD